MADSASRKLQIWDDGAPSVAVSDRGRTAPESTAAPLVAGMVAAAQQGQQRPFGFIDR